MSWDPVLQNSRCGIPGWDMERVTVSERPSLDVFLGDLG